MTMFDDDDPEDGFDATDPVEDRIRNIIVRLSYVLNALNDPELERRIRSVTTDLDKVRLEILDG